MQAVQANFEFLCFASQGIGGHRAAARGDELCQANSPCGKPTRLADNAV